MPAKQKTILFCPLDGWGHINACHGLAQAVKDRGHRVVFAVDKQFKGKLLKYGFEEEVHSDPQWDENSFFWAELVAKVKDVFKLTPIEIIEKFCVIAFEAMFASAKRRDSQYRDIIARVRPDLIVVDAYCASPSLTNSDVPWVWLYSAAPHLCLLNDKIPPGWSGLPLNGDKREWKEFETKFEEIFSDLHSKINKWLVSSGAPPLASKASALHPESKDLNVFMYPKELFYEEVQPLPHNYRRVDGFVRHTDDTFELPDCLVDKPGKLVFLSMGSFGCANLDLMTRLVAILAKSEHNFIVSKGPLADKYELPDNMWGSAFVPQTAVLPMVDLVITHGGNNTVTETFFYGKPMLVMPLFGDQFDNAQRIQEKGLGLRLSPFHCTEDELLSSVDRLVNDLDIRQKMSDIGNRIRQSDDKRVVAQLFEQIIEKNKNCK